MKKKHINISRDSIIYTAWVRYCRCRYSNRVACVIWI